MFNDYLFIRIPKTASSSVCNVLDRVIDHKRAREWRQELPNFDSLTKFSVVRNPYDRFISMFYFFPLFGNQNERKDPNTWLANHTFEELINRKQGHWMIRRQAEYLTDEQGNMMVDKLIHFENLAQEWADFAPTINVSPQLPFIRKNKLRPSNTVLTKNSIEKIHKFYEKDFTLLNYPDEYTKIAPVDYVVPPEVVAPVHTFMDDFVGTHCKNGHEFTKQNTQYFFAPPDGKQGRRCMTCREEEML